MYVDESWGKLFNAKNLLPQDATLKRCYGDDRKIIDCDWKFLSKQRTLQAPHEPMPRLRDLLEYLASPGREEIWLLLDIKVFDCGRAVNSLA